MIRTILQIAIFVMAVILIILCIIQSNNGSNVLDGLTNSSSELFETKKYFKYKM